MGQLKRSTLFGRCIAFSVVLTSGLALFTGSQAAALQDGRANRPGGASVALSLLAGAWPTTWTVSGTHSEATYVEHVTISRRGDDFTLSIVITAEGAQSGGVWSRSVRVDRTGGIVDLIAHDCGGDCAALNGTRGYLAAAVLVALYRSGKFPARTTARRFGARTLLCTNGGALYRAAGMALPGAGLDLDPCVDPGTGAVLAQYAPALGTFGGPTLDTATVRITT